MWYLATLVVSFALYVSSVYALYNSSLIVSTNVGRFRGLDQSLGTVAWLGVPYGAKPVRYRPAQRAEILSEGSVFNATKFGLGCPQNKGAGYQAGERLFPGILGNFTEGEDCLLLNIWAPSPERVNASKLAAVIVFFHGGGYGQGGSAVQSYNGTWFVQNNDDLIYVTINYRLSIFGFPMGSTVSPLERNLGMADQRLAVEWVYNNIRSFGGDPKRIILHGESAGASSIATWLYAYQYDPIASGLIMQSGSEITVSNRTVTNETMLVNAWNTTANSSGCPLNISREAQFDCMQRVPFARIQQAVSNSSVADIFQPQVDNLTIFTPAEYLKKARSGQYACLPALLGTNDDEGTTLLSLYKLPVSPATITKQLYTCVAALQAQTRVNNSVPVWQYRYQASFPGNINKYPSLGVFHASELPLVFGDYINLPNVTAEQRELSTSMQTAWAAFAKDPRTGLTRQGWPMPTSNVSSLALIRNAGFVYGTSELYNQGCQQFYPQLK